MSAPAEDPAQEAPSQAEQAQKEEAERKPLRQFSITAFEGGGFLFTGLNGFNPMNDLGGVLGDLMYAQKWIQEQWELSFVSGRIEAGVRAQRELMKNAPAVIPGSAAPAFLRRGGH